MYTQFFGNFLLNKGILTSEQLLEAIEAQASARMKVGTLAMHAGYMTASEVDSIVIMQTHQDRLFGELAVEQGYLTPEQLDELLKEQIPNYLLLGQSLIEKGILSNTEFENLIIDYQSENELYDLEAESDLHDELDHILEGFCPADDPGYTERFSYYAHLLFNNLIRFIGDDFSILDPVPCPEYPANYSILQKVNGTTMVTSMIDAEEDSAIQFASRYAGEDFNNFDEYVKAALEDFLNLHNGLFIVNISNEYSENLNLTPPEVFTRNETVPIGDDCYMFPVIYPFGTIHFVFSLHRAE